MVKSKRSRSNHRAPSTEEATELARAIQALGDFAHVTVRAERGYLHVFAGDEEPIARLTPLPSRPRAAPPQSPGARHGPARSPPGPRPPAAATNTGAPASTDTRAGRGGRNARTPRRAAPAGSPAGPSNAPGEKV